MRKSTDKFRGGALIASAGLVAALLVVSVGPSSAGPFTWFKGKNQQNQEPQSDSGGGGSSSRRASLEAYSAAAGALRSARRTPRHRLRSFPAAIPKSP